MAKFVQNKVAESRYLLPIMALFSLGVWYIGGLVEYQLWIQLAILVMSTYLMVELNNANSLIRVYSRMVSASFLALTSASAFLFPSIRTAVVQLCVIMFYTILFHTYQDKQAPGLTFYAFLCLGIASLAFIQILFFLPLLWLLMLFNLMAFSSRMFWASIFGVITPYWFLTPVAVYLGHSDQLITHFLSIADFQPLFQYTDVPEHYIVTFLFIILMAIIGGIHYIRKSFQDKIRTRMIYEFFLWMTGMTAVFIILQPQHTIILLGILIVNTSPLIGHFLALTHTRWTNVMFYVIIILTLFFTVYNLWIPSLLS